MVHQSSHMTRAQFSTDGWHERMLPVTSSKLQAPTSRETSKSKLQDPRAKIPAFVNLLRRAYGGQESTTEDGPEVTRALPRGRQNPKFKEAAGTEARRERRT